jgi:hypothetical protein
MGAWGPKSFENDGALDWIGEVIEDGGVELVAAALDAVIEGKTEYLEGDVCEEGIAAAEILAAAGGAPAGDLPEDARSWAAAQPKPDATLYAKAVEAMAAVREKSELRELWEDSEHFAAWNAAMDDLDKRLAAAQSGRA